MAVESVENAKQEKTLTARQKEVRRFVRVFFSRKLVLFGVIVLVLFVLMAIFASVLSPYDPNKNDMMNILAKMSSKHWLGTDGNGRDVLSRLLYGSRVSLLVGVAAVGTATVVGMLLGLLAGYYGGVVNAVIMRIMDTIQSIPTVLLAVTIAALLGGGVRNVIIAIGVSLVPTYARLMRSQVLVVKQHDYIAASTVIGATHARTMLKHITPNCFPPLIVQITMQVGHAILSEASLSFLGVGIAPPTSAWGSMVSDGFNVMLQSPIVSIAPGLALMLVVFAFNMVGDGLRDALDPRLRGAI